ncbi:MFS transporter [Bacillaceae bacterium S4-13-56]
MGHFIFLLSFIYLLFANSFLSFAIAMAILTIGEMLVWPGVPSLADDLAPKGRAGFYQGLINSVGTAGRMVGPVLGGFIVDIYSIEILFYGLLILFIIPFVATHFYDRKLNSEQLERVEN